MKCPKCGYVGYAHADRCRNCGYEFALSAPDAIGELRLNDREQVPEPLRDLELVDGAKAAPPDPFSDVIAEGSHGRRRADSPNPIAELPLFGPPIMDDVPLITRPSPPRPPLAVRRATPEVPRLRSEPRAPSLDWAEPPSQPTPQPLPKIEIDPEALNARPPRSARPKTETLASTASEAEPAGLGSRAMAAAIDVLLLAIVDVVVVYFTLKICRISIGELALLPKAPLAAFLLLQNGGYFVAFTATGQTLGKMIAGVKVLADDEDHAPDVGRSTLRAVVWLLLALPAGLGLLVTLLMRDGRGLHDRFAGTRVVRAGA